MSPLHSGCLIEKRSEWFLWTLPGTTAVGLSVLGNWSAAATHLALLLFIPLGVLLLLWGALLLALVAVRRWRGNRARPLLTGLLLSVLGVFALGDAVLRVPQWVKVAAAPALASLERWRTEHGRYPRVESGDRAFPSELRETLEGAGCLRYLAWGGESFQLTCAGYDYWSATQTWSAFD